MRHRKSKRTLDRTSPQRQRLLRNLAVALITHEKIRTTDARAKATRRLVERLITTGQKKTLAARRQLLRVIPNQTAVNKVIDTLSPRYAQRHGGYSRLTKIGLRQGDGAQMVVMELIQ